MHKLLRQVLNLLILSCCLYGAVLSAAYASLALHEKAEHCLSAPDFAGEGFSIHREGMGHARFGSLAPALSGIMSETESELNKDSPVFADLHSTRNGAGLYADPFAQPNPATVTFPFRNRSIFLLDCAFLI
ncbi:MAG: hypothetical protein RIG62_30585 [Cyclobacteriaceae bacterium]